MEWAAITFIIFAAMLAMALLLLRDWFRQRSRSPQILRVIESLSESQPLVFTIYPTRDHLLKESQVAYAKIASPLGRLFIIAFLMMIVGFGTHGLLFNFWEWRREAGFYEFVSEPLGLAAAYYGLWYFLVRPIMFKKSLRLVTDSQTQQWFKVECAFSVEGLHWSANEAKGLLGWRMFDHVVPEEDGIRIWFRSGESLLVPGDSAFTEGSFDELAEMLGPLVLPQRRGRSR